MNSDQFYDYNSRPIESTDIKRFNMAKYVDVFGTKPYIIEERKQRFHDRLKPIES